MVFIRKKKKLHELNSSSIAASLFAYADVRDNVKDFYFHCIIMRGWSDRLVTELRNFPQLSGKQNIRNLRVQLKRSFLSCLSRC